MDIFSIVRFGLLLVTIFPLVTCGDSDEEVIARIGWRFNYADYTDSNTTPDWRGCDNHPDKDLDFDAPPYRAIEAVRVVLTDEAGLIPGMDKEFIWY